MVILVGEAVIAGWVIGGGIGMVQRVAVAAETFLVGPELVELFYTFRFLEDVQREL